MWDLLDMCRKTGITIPANAAKDGPAMPEIIWHNASSTFPGESLEAAKAAAIKTFGKDPEIIFVALPRKEKEIYEEVLPPHPPSNSSRSPFLQNFWHPCIDIGALLGCASGNVTRAPNTWRFRPGALLRQQKAFYKEVGA